MDGFAYPNELEIQWSLLIVLYPFITGLVAGAFVVSSLYHLFNIQALKPVASFSLLTSLSFLFAAPMALQAHLGHPERGFLIFITPNKTSAMAGFGYIWLFYLILVLVEVWLVFRPHIVQTALLGSGVSRLVCRALAVGVYEITPEARHTDERLIKIFAGVGIPSAALLHGYVGFLFGAIKANPWWSTPLMPVIFLLSAIVSGIALLTIMYVATMKLTGRKVDPDCVRALLTWLFGFLAIDLAIEGLELLSMAYEAEESWETISRLISERLFLSYVGIQVLLGSLLPLTVLAYLTLGKAGNRAVVQLGVVSSALVVVGVFAMRWNVVIGGQLVSKSLRGLLSYAPPIGGREGVLAALVLLLVPFYIFAFLVKLFPPWQHEAGEEAAEAEGVPAAVPEFAAVTTHIGFRSGRIDATTDGRADV